MTIKVIASTQDNATGFKLFKFGSIIPDKYEGSLIQTFANIDGKVTVDFGVDLGEAIKLAGSLKSITLGKGKGTEYIGGDHDITAYTSVEVGVTAPKKRKKKAE